MTPEDKKLIVDALLSGEYKQTKGQLARLVDGQEHNCCLGVICRIFGSSRGQSVLGITYDGNAATLPKKLYKRLGTDEFGRLPKPVDINGEKTHCLCSLNDRGIDFSTIAKIIDERF